MTQKEHPLDVANISGIIGGAVAILIGKHHNIYEGIIGYIICFCVALAIIKSTNE
jgi:hypothetical protein